MTKTKVIRKKKKIKNIEENNINDDDDNDDDDDENSLKLLNKKVLKIQKKCTNHITTSFIKNEGYVSLSVY
jgi:hypothetical protein